MVIIDPRLVASVSSLPTPTPAASLPRSHVNKTVDNGGPRTTLLAEIERESRGVDCRREQATRNDTTPPNARFGHG